ncbi:hypothetical protein CsSME_00015520 [Camellia sinensis var. sinensis]
MASFPTVMILSPPPQSLPFLLQSQHQQQPSNLSSLHNPQNPNNLHPQPLPSSSENGSPCNQISSNHQSHWSRACSESDRVVPIFAAYLAIGNSQQSCHIRSGFSDSSLRTLSPWHWGFFLAQHSHMARFWTL